MFRKNPPAALSVLIDDSKKLSASRRQIAYQALLAADDIDVSVAAASVGEIGRLNILQASFLAMQRAVMRLPVRPDLVLVDGNRAPVLPCVARTVVGGDALSLSIAAASIVAKIVRDRAMTRLALRHDAYAWERNAGYGTRAHMDGLRSRGVTPHHRAGFAPIRALMQELAA